MGIEQFHNLPRIWHFTEDSKFVLDYEALEKVFNERSRQEGFTTEKQYIYLKNIDVDNANRVLNLDAELYKLLEN